MDRIENIEFCIRYLLEIEKTKLGIETGIPHDLRGKQRLLRALMNIWEPQPLSEEYLRAQDAELQAQIQDKGVVTLEDITASVPRSVLLWQGDITRLRVDAIVNAANSQMMGCWYPLHTCIDNCIHSAAGLQLRAECAEAMSSAECPSVHPEYTRNNTTYRQAFTSETLITEAYNLPCQYVIHTVGPRWNGGVSGETLALAGCYRGALDKTEFGYYADGARRVNSFIIPENYNADIAIRDAAKVAYLARLIQTGSNQVKHYAPEMNEELAATLIENQELNKLNRIKRISLEAFFYLLEIEKMAEK